MCWEESYTTVTKRKKGGKRNERRKKKGIKIETDTAARIKTTFYQMKIDDRAQPSDVPWEMVTLFNTFFFFLPFYFLPVVTVFREKALERHIPQKKCLFFFFFLIF
jgi:hypothetical protein